MATRPVVRWALPAGVVAAVLGGTAIATTLTASAQASLPPRSPAQLLVDVQTAQLDGASGTVVERADLGLPALPDSLGGGEGSANLNSLITGSHTLRVWYSGPDKSRVALLGALGESDVIRNGTDVWIWSSSTNTATHQVLGKDGAKPDATAPRGPLPTPTDLPKTPQEAANAVLAQLDPSTAVSVDPAAVVAGRPAYQLVLAPKDKRSLVARVTIAIDGTKHVPLEVQVFAKGYTPPAFKIGFTDVSFARPSSRLFTFTPPPNAKVNQGDGMPGRPDSGAMPDSARPRTAVIGTGWTTVLAARLPQSADATQAPGQTGSPALDRILGALPHVSGSWGSGRLLSSRLFSALLTDDGRVLIGAVNGQQLLAAAADPAAALR